MVGSDADTQSPSLSREQGAGDKHIDKPTLKPKGAKSSSFVKMAGFFFAFGIPAKHLGCCGQLCKRRKLQSPAVNSAVTSSTVDSEGTLTGGREESTVQKSAFFCFRQFLEVAPTQIPTC
jgi:hypothetical protein